MSMTEFDWTPLVELLVAVLAFVVTTYVVPWLKAKLGNERYKSLAEAVCTAVQYAEQVRKDQEKAGAEKKALAREYLEQQGIEITPQVDGMIESAVYELT